MNFSGGVEYTVLDELAGNILEIQGLSSIRVLSFKSSACQVSPLA